MGEKGNHPHEGVKGRVMELAERVSRLLLAGGVSRPTIEIVARILECQDKLAVYEGCRGTLYVDYAPGDVKLRIDRLGLEPVGRTSLAS
jgi:hypothetical protein